MGDKFENISNSTIINRSLLSDSLNNMSSQFGDEFKNALRSVANHIEKSGNKESADLLDGFNKEMSTENPNKSVLKVMWDGLVNSIPDAAKVASGIATISKLFI